MGKSKESKKGRVDWSELPPARIGFLEHLISNNPKYISVPSSAEMREKEGLWMSFEKDIYYVIGVFDAKSRPCKISELEMTMQIEWVTHVKTERATFHGYPSANVFWFKAVRFHASGEMIVSFSLPREGRVSIKPLVCKVDVTRSGSHFIHVIFFVVIV